MTFIDNCVQLSHEPSGLTLSFCAADALASVLGPHERPLSVAVAEHWLQHRDPYVTMTLYSLACGWHSALHRLLLHMPAERAVLLCKPALWICHLIGP